MISLRMPNVVYRRLMENYSGFLEHTDVEIGRLISASKKPARWTTRSFSISLATTGASGEGGLKHGQ